MARAGDQQQVFIDEKVKGLMPTREDLKSLIAPVFRGTVLGSALGILPGPAVMIEQPMLLWGIIASMWICNFFLVVNLAMIGLGGKMMPYHFLYPAVLAFSTTMLAILSPHIIELIRGRHVPPRLFLPEREQKNRTSIQIHSPMRMFMGHLHFGSEGILFRKFSGRQKGMFWYCLRGFHISQ